MSLTPEKYKLTIWKGATFRKRMTLLSGGVGSDPQDLTNYTAELDIQDAPDGDSLLLLTDSNGGIILGDTAGTIEIFIDDAVTDALTWSVGFYTLYITAPSGGDTNALIYGGVVVRET